MRHKHLARLGRAPANGNCNRRDDGSSARHAAKAATPAWLTDDADEQEEGVEDMADFDSDEDHPDRPGYHRGVPCAACTRKLAAARRHRDRQLWILARELCASATLYRVGGRAPTALRSLQLAFTMLSGRAGTFEPAALRD